MNSLTHACECLCTLPWQEFIPSTKRTEAYFENYFTEAGLHQLVTFQVGGLRGSSVSYSEGNQLTDFSHHNANVENLEGLLCQFKEDLGKT